MSNLFLTTLQQPCGPLCTECSVLTPILPSPPIATPNLAVAHVAPWKQAYGMEQVWLGEFANLFQSYRPHQWSLFPVHSAPFGLWNQFVDSAKVSRYLRGLHLWSAPPLSDHRQRMLRLSTNELDSVSNRTEFMRAVELISQVRFSCVECGHGWTSMKGRIAFWFVQATNGEGLIAFKLYGQQCDKCKSGRFQSAMWYPEEVVKVLVNLYNRVGQIYYGFVEPPMQKTRRAGKPRTPHNASLCQACYDGVCTEQNRPS